MRHDESQLTREREEAWIGDAVLALFVREWILREKGTLDGEQFVRFTSNDFLRGMGNPTAVEAEIGRVYRDGGLAEGFRHIETQLLPHFVQRERVRERQLRSGKIRR